MTKKVWEKEFWRKVDIKWRKGGLQADEGRRRWGKHPADFLDTLSVKQFINSLLAKQKKEIILELEEIRVEVKEEWKDDKNNYGLYVDGITWNNALDQAIKTIKKI